VAAVLLMARAVHCGALKWQLLWDTAKSETKGGCMVCLWGNSSSSRGICGVVCVFSTHVCVCGGGGGGEGG
jgi:hypothetical protein